MQKKDVISKMAAKKWLSYNMATILVSQLIMANCQCCSLFTAQILCFKLQLIYILALVPALCAGPSPH